MKVMKHQLFLFLMVSVKLVMAQTCRDYSQTCIDDYACCGGCCINGICRDVYKDCRKSDDICLNHYCPPDEECYIYQPDDCEGCGSIQDCRSVDSVTEEATEKVLIEALNSSSPKKFQHSMLFFSIVYVISINVRFYLNPLI